MSRGADQIETVTLIYDSFFEFLRNPDEQNNIKKTGRHYLVLWERFIVSFSPTKSSNESVHEAVEHKEWKKKVMDETSTNAHFSPRDHRVKNALWNFFTGSC